MTMARLSGAVVALIAIALIVWAVFGYQRMAADVTLPTGGVTAGPADDVPVDDAANAALAERARLQDWRGESGPAPDEPAAAATPRDLQAQAVPATEPHVQPWITHAASDISLLRDREFVGGITNLPDPDAGFLLQEAGREWRRFHNTEVTVGGGIGVLAMLALLGAFLAVRGRVRLKHGFSGQWVPRFDGYERFNHWMTAVSFIVLALTGLILLYGQFFLRPLTGAEAYSDVAGASLWLHLGFIVPFILGVLTMAVLWMRQNGFNRVDLTWLKRGGGMLFESKKKPPAYRFNAGQKMIFWAVVLGSLFLLASGLSVLFPLVWLDLQGTQLALILHAIAGLVMVAVILAHIYIGTIGMEGAFDAMWSGEVDRNWAEEHHDLWVRDEGLEAKARPAGAGAD
jgi:formate dehydrogenase subunit gamma